MEWNTHILRDRQDYQELSDSPVIKTPGLRTWIYYDAQAGEALPNTVDSSGNPVTGTFTGSRYISYDAALSKMKIQKEFPSELNSDLIATVQEFLEFALADCLSNGFNSTMAVFSSQ
jgi:hypothetical protein